MKYKTYLRNHVVLPGSEKPLHTFLNSILVDGNGKEKKHKLEHAFSPNSEDALTWSCFDVLRHQPQERIIQALSEIMEDAFEGKANFSFEDEKNIKIHIGKNYHASTLNENTELDASIETDDKLIFIEAKLYSKISLPDEDKPYDQLIKKLRVGLDVANRESKKFYFIFLDIAPIDYTLKFGEKAVNAEYFKKYTENSNTLSDKLIANSYQSLEDVSQNMGWLTWACLFKTVLRATIK
ncbi:MAG: hypothetical protein OJF59_000592 [Cytophagales bacterium]|jgi:hypothetical protein|nr:MAG: hypothetical protein OJF59_000592 [Cytophagales bacterium]